MFQIPNDLPDHTQAVWPDWAIFDWFCYLIFQQINPGFWQLFGLFWRTSLWSRNLCVYFWATLRTIWLLFRRSNIRSRCYQWITFDETSPRWPEDFVWWSTCVRNCFAFEKRQCTLFLITLLQGWRSHVRFTKQAAALEARKNTFLNGPTPTSFSFIFGLFNQTIQV